jgi:hypothetical protein
MLPLVLGGIALAATGYKLKKYLDDDDNYDKFHDSLINGYELLNRVDEKVDGWFDTLLNKIENPKEGTTYDVDLSEFLKPREVSKNLLEPLQGVISQLHQSLFRDTDEAIGSLKNLHREEPISIFTDLKGVETLKETPENNRHIREFYTICIKAERIQYHLLDELEQPLSESDDFEHLSDEDKAKVKRLIETDELLRQACRIAITYDGVFVGKIAKRTFGRIKSLLV